MGQTLLHKALHIEGMTCTSCEMRIENKLEKIAGIVEVKAVYSNSKVHITYDDNCTELESISEAIKELGYKVINLVESEEKKEKEMRIVSSSEKISVNQAIGFGIILFAIYIITKNTIGFNFLPVINQNMGYGILFVVGLITSLHCIAMCGGINLSQCISYKQTEVKNSYIAKMKPSLMYNAGRIISYTIIGGIVGALGAVITFSGATKGIVAILSGVFMIIMGLNMLNVFPWLRKLNPRMPKVFGNKLHHNSAKNNPFFVGLLNGFMPCGPLQAMQIYALGTGSFVAGAFSMFMFSLGTVPLMFGFGAISTFLSGKFTQKMMKASAVLVMILGIIMLNRGLSLSGVNVAYASSSGAENIARIEGNVQVVATTLESGKYEPIVLQEGIPVKWNIKAAAGDINGCNNELIIPKYNIQQKLEPGDNTISFTPDQDGNIPYSCWMGMIRSNIKVVEDLSKVSEIDITPTNSEDAGAYDEGCCGETPPKFADGKIPTDSIQITQVKDGKQEVTINVNNQGYTPAVAIVQKGIEVKIKFNNEQLNSCNSIVDFPQYQGSLDLSKQNETPWLIPEQDFTFQCGMNMLHGYIKVVEDVNKVNLEEIKREIENYIPPAGVSGGSCH